MSTHARKPWTAIQRAILEAVRDGEPQWAERLYQQLEMPRRNSGSQAFAWFLRHGYLTQDRSETGYVILGTNRTNRTNRKHVLTDKGREAANNLDAGYELLDH
ncbi:hypothetical protein [Nocardia salmonicida]|uniref:hypothetical protein n=1 Tax=Nocardia salmonicida TaxID=53431 RepID=UPI0007A39142|nr:hypothetical protein [Nocardia salmonicida]